MSPSGPRFALAALALAPVLTGCVVFKALPKGEQTGVDRARVTFTICASSEDVGASCPDLGNSDEDADARDIVVLLGIRVPEGTRLPRKLEPVASDVPGVLRRARQYGRVLNEEAPTPVGYRWIGYRSAAKPTDENDTARFRVAVRLPDGFDGRRFRFRPVVGFFRPIDVHPADSPIVCGPALFHRVDDDDGDRACIDSPAPDDVATHLAIPID